MHIGKSDEALRELGERIGLDLLGDEDEDEVKAKL